MNYKTRISIFAVIIALMLALPVSALANKHLFQANLRGETQGRGSATVATNPNGTIQFFVSVRNVSSPVTAIHIHSALDGSILVTLCGGGSCPANDGSSLSISGLITPSMMAVSGGELVALLNDGNTYVNVHTENFPAGEISGTLEPH